MARVVAEGVIFLVGWWGWFRRLNNDPIVDPRTGRQVKWNLRGHRKED